MRQKNATEETAWESAKNILWLFLLALLVFVAGLMAG
jgi:hypothetical protein